MSDSITVTGIVATTPRHLVTSSGLAITSFRLASSQRRFDRVKQTWVDAETNWYTVSSFRQLAHNVVHSVQKGEHVVVAGRLRIRPWENADRNGTSVEVEADTVGHDLAWCSTVYTRSPQQGARSASHPTEPTDGFLPDETADAPTARAEAGAAAESAALVGVDS